MFFFAFNKRLLWQISALLLLLSPLLQPAVSADAAQWTSSSKNRLFNATLGPQQGSVSINKLQNWVVSFSDKNGAALIADKVFIDGGMRGHGHGLPTQAQITKMLEPGTYLIEGVRLNMVGDWTLMIAAEIRGQRDAALFDIKVDY